MQAQLIDDLLDVSRIEAGKLEMRFVPLDLSSEIETALRLAQPVADERHLTLAVDVGTTGQVYGDPIRLRQIFSNLLTNALKFTPAGGTITVSAEELSDGRARVRVRDTGVGIEAAMLPHVFHPFVQLRRDEDARDGGVGLGLAIVQYLVKEHRGTIEVESEGPGRGTTCTVTVPLIRGEGIPPPAYGAPARHDSELAGVRVVILDDDQSTRDALVRLLQGAGAEVHAAATAAEAFAALAAKAPHVMVCDIDMPDETGNALMKRIRALPADQGGEVPAIAVTALAGTLDRQQAIEAGYQAHFAKPVDVDALLDTLVQLSRPVP
jgi:CheY-like chemotaxis protein/anti-sigma regulatory factor (Ser/Thr protein kinase)